LVIEATKDLLSRRVIITESRKAMRKRLRRQESKASAHGKQVELEIAEFSAALAVDVQRRERLDLGRCYRVLARRLSRYCFLDDWVSEGTIRSSELALTDRVQSNADLVFLLSTAREIAKQSGSI